MKPIKMFGLAALAALMAMAFVGASSAMAGNTALCKVDPLMLEGEVHLDNCSAENLISHVHETSDGKATLLSSSLNVECNVLFLGEVLKLASPQIIHGNFTYSNCNNSCTVAEENGPALIEVLKEGHELAKVTGEGLVKLNCLFGFVKCSYNGEGLEGHGLGPLLSELLGGSVVIEKQETTIESGGCPSSAFLDITTTPLENEHIYIGS